MIGVDCTHPLGNDWFLFLLGNRSRKIIFDLYVIDRRFANILGSCKPEFHSALDTPDKL